MHVVRVKQVNLYDIRAKQASRYNVVHAIETVAAQSADCMACSLQTARPPCSLQTARCSLQTARGFQIAWNITIIIVSLVEDILVRFQIRKPRPCVLFFRFRFGCSFLKILPSIMRRHNSLPPLVPSIWKVTKAASFG